MKTFKTLYTKLNKEQKEAVDTLEGPVMVIAGPGTGKTQILAMRIANILHKKKTAPEKILALTFSRTGVSAMQKRLGLLAGAQGYYVPVFTFHGFCENIIQTHLEEFPQLRHAIGDGGSRRQLQRLLRPAEGLGVRREEQQPDAHYRPPVMPRRMAAAGALASGSRVSHTTWRERPSWSFSVRRPTAMPPRGRISPYGSGSRPLM